jgi:TonB-linked SusC/RagA family outer membrane protein
MKRFLLLSVVIVFFLATSLIAQERTISGRVMAEETGTPVPGVNVILKGTTIGTVSDIDGNYKVNVPAEGGTLVFSFIGLATEEVRIGDQSVINMGMTADIRQLTEVVVTAIGVEREQKALGYAVKTVDTDDITRARETNIVNQLTGRVAGAQITSTSGGVGASSRIVLRGASSITGNNQPLFVVDGVPISNMATGDSGSGGGNDFGNGAAALNPDDIESITVLKGPNAAALYGSRASNGVIVVTTKKGQGTKGIGISVNSTTTFERPMVLPTWQNSYGQGSSNKFFEWIDGSAGSGGVDESWGPPLDVGLEFVQWTSDGEYAEPWVSQPENVNDFFETGVTNSTNVAFSAGNNDGSFRLSLTNLTQDGSIPGTNLDRLTTSLGATYNFVDWLSSDFTVNWVKTKSDNIPTTGYIGENPLQQFIWSGRNVDFNALRDYENLPPARAGLGAGITPINWNTRFQNNPFWNQDNVLNSFDNNRLFGNARVSFQILDDLRLHVRTGIDYFTEIQERKIEQGGADTENGNGYYRNYQEQFLENNTDFLLTYQKKFGSDYNLGVSFGGNRMSQKWQWIYGEAPQLELPGVFNLSNTKSGVNKIAENHFQRKQIQSLYGTVNFAYGDFVFVDFTARNDWSSTLPSGENSYFYPGVNLSFVLSELLNWSSTFLKLKGSWAQVGSDTQPYRLTQTYAFFDPWGAVIKPTVANTLLNPGLKPEITTSIEFGIDVRLFNNRLGVDVTYYDASTKDQIIPIEISKATGYASRYANIGEMTNTGIEVELNARPVDRAFKWDIYISFARNQNEVISLAPGLDQLNLGGQWNVDIQARPGETYGSIFGPGYKKDPEGNIINEDGLPVIDEEYRVLGNVTPDYIWGITNNFTYKGIYLNALIDGRQGGDIYTMTTTWGRYAGVLYESLKGREGGIVGEGVKDVGDETYVPNDVVVPAKQYNQRAYSNDVAEGSVFDGSFIKFRQLELGYIFPDKLWGNFPLKGLRVSIVGRNLAFLYKTIPHIDPETSFNNANAQGMEFGQLPTSRSIGFNVGFQF